jgi:hypothetical protein
VIESNASHTNQRNARFYARAFGLNISKNRFLASYVVFDASKNRIYTRSFEGLLNACKKYRDGGETIGTIEKEARIEDQNKTARAIAGEYGLFSV